MYSRINLSRTNYALERPNFDAKLMTNFDAHGLQMIYRDYCLHKKFPSVMPLFIEEFHYPQSTLIGYTYKDKLVGYTLMFTYNLQNVAAAQFAWDYKTPWLRIGIESIKHLCAYYKAESYEYIYLGGDEPYKRQIEGYELCGPMS